MNTVRVSPSRTGYSFRLRHSSRTWAPPSERRSLYLRLYFSEVSGEVHGPMLWAAHERVEQIQQWLEEEMFRFLCVDEETNQWLAHVELSTESGIVLDFTRTLDEYHVVDGDTLYVVVIPWTSTS